MKDEDKTKKQILKELTLLRRRIAELETLEASRHRVEKALYRQNEYLTALHETTLGLINRLELADLLQAILERAAAMMGTKHGYVYLFEPGKGEREVLRVGIGLHRTGVGYRLRKGKGFAGRVWQTGEPFVLENYHSWPGRLPDTRFDGQQEP